MNIGKSVTEARRLKGYTQEELAEYSGLSRSYICDIEKNRYTPSIKALQRLGDALGTQFFIFADDDGNTRQTAGKQIKTPPG